MNIRTYIAPALLAGAALLATSAQAASVDATLGVQLIINGTCTITAGGAVDFGTTGSTNSAPITATENFTVNCTSGIPYVLEIDAGAGAGATVDLRKMTITGGGTDVVDYTLKHTSAAGPIWGDGTGASTTLADIGTGTAQVHTVYGEVPLQMTPSNGTYQDTVTVTVNW